MNINSSNMSLTPNQLSSANKVVKEFAELENKIASVDNKDSVDLNSSKGEVKLDFTQVNQNAKEKYTGDMKFDPSTNETKELFMTKNYDKQGGVGVNYVKRELDAENVYLRKDDMYQEFPMYRQIDEVVVNKVTGEVKSFESYEERDTFNGFGDFFIAH